MGADAVAASCTVRYRVFPASEADSSLASLSRLKNAIDSMVLSRLSNVDGYLWQRERFSIDVVPASSSSLDKPAHLSGSVEFGDCIDDEWMVVWILFEISKTHKGVIIDVVDDDGQFLLIEAAHSLPEWLTPECSDNRVFIVNGNLSILRRSICSQPTLSIALSLLRSSSSSCIEVSSASLSDRLSGFPFDAMVRSRHCTRVLLHYRAAALLRSHPHIVSAAVEAFYTRDPIETRQLQRMSSFPCSDPRTWTRIRFSRCLYAQLSSQRFTEPIEFQTHWPKFNEGDQRVRGRLDGIKLMCGLQILASRKGTTAAGDDVAALLTDIHIKDAEAVTSFDSLGEDDDISWSMVSLEDVEAMTASYTYTDNQPVNEVAPAIVQKMQAFVESESGFEGFEHDQPFNFDVQEFMNALRGLDGQADTGVDVDERFYAEEHEDERLREYMEQMDAEIGASDALFGGFERPQGEEAADIDVDVNLVKNMLEAFASEMGEAGPASNLMQSLGLKLPQEHD